MSKVRVRFAPSPTGALHIGSVRTAMFNWLFAKHNKGKFLLRIEDTDKLRSTNENTKLIFDILKWLGIDYDEEPIIQSSRIDRHKEIALDLVKKGKAYFCYCSQEELAKKKEECLKNKNAYKYDRTCRDINDSGHQNTKPVIRLKTEIESNIQLNDIVQRGVNISTSQLDDLVLLRSDGTPTYMLSVVVDDHDMDITHVIRGDDHLTNTFKQIEIYKACGWEIPKFAHIPLIYGPDGAKLSKRHGAVSSIDYMNLGYLPESIFNYLLRLGWSHGDDDIISKNQAIEWFSLENIGKSPSRFDIAKLQNLNSHYINQKEDKDLLDILIEFIKTPLLDIQKSRILKGMTSLKKRAKTLIELKDAASIYISAPKEYLEECKKYSTINHLNLLENVIEIINNTESLNENNLNKLIKDLADQKNVKLIEIAQAIRASLCGKLFSPSVFEIIEILGKEESINRIKSFISKN